MGGFCSQRMYLLVSFFYPTPSPDTLGGWSINAKKKKRKRKGEKIIIRNSEITVKGIVWASRPGGLRGATEVPLSQKRHKRCPKDGGAAQGGPVWQGQCPVTQPSLAGQGLSLPAGSEGLFLLCPVLGEPSTIPAALRGLSQTRGHRAPSTESSQPCPALPDTFLSLCSFSGFPCRGQSPVLPLPALALAGFAPPWLLLLESVKVGRNSEMPRGAVAALQ